jgi:hypothetical protein
MAESELLHDGAIAKTGRRKNEFCVFASFQTAASGYR